MRKSGIDGNPDPQNLMLPCVSLAASLRTARMTKSTSLRFTVHSQTSTRRQSLISWCGRVHFRIFSGYASFVGVDFHRSFGTVTLLIPSRIRQSAQKPGTYFLFSPLLLASPSPLIVLTLVSATLPLSDVFFLPFYRIPSQQIPSHPRDSLSCTRTKPICATEIRANRPRLAIVGCVPLTGILRIPHPEAYAD